MDLKYEIAVEKDIPELTKIMTITFDDDSQKFLGQEKGGPDGYDNGEFFKRWMIQEPSSTGYKIVFNNKLVGFFLVFIRDSDKNSLGTIFILPEYQDKGTGFESWSFIEKSFPAKSWILDTPSWAVRNHHFYEKKCSFKKIREQSFIEDDPSAGKLFIYLKEYTN